MSPQSRSVLIMAGGTGGHVFPALATAVSLQAKGVHVEWLGTERGIESRVVPAAGIPIHYLSVSGLRGKNIVDMLRGVFNVFRALLHAIKLIRLLKPVCVLGMGGFVAGPGGLAAWLLRKPLVIHEQNAVAGTTNKLLSKFANKVLLGYPIGLGGSKGCHVGNPVRQQIVLSELPEKRDIGHHERLRLLVVGGSLGARPINEIMPQVIAALTLNAVPEIRHQAGRGHLASVEALYSANNIEAEVTEFIEDMAQAYSWADLVICRAGALTVTEITVVGVASILVPLPYAIDDHQTANARWLSDNDAAVLLAQRDMSVDRLKGLIEDFDQHREKLMSMAQLARSLARPEAASQVADICLEVACG